MPSADPSLTRRTLLGLATGGVVAGTLAACSRSEILGAPGHSETAGDDARDAPPTTTSTATPAITPPPNAAEAELPGGGRVIFPASGRRYVALYGHPGSRSLGVLGERDVDASIAAVTELAAQYERIDGTPTVPALEIIATVAISSPGPLGTYSAQWPQEKYLPWVERAYAEGVAVVLDLQPGMARLLDQAQAYTDLLGFPNVGLGIDPEWKLAPGQKPLTTIGHVEASEINEVSDWLAKHVAQHRLAQKLFVVHQFRDDMVRHRAQLVTDHPELAVVLHVDGQGAQSDKRTTWRAIRHDAPPNVQWGWKNFYDEDQPMLTPRQTLRRVIPAPALISYQ